MLLIRNEPTRRSGQWSPGAFTSTVNRRWQVVSATYELTSNSGTHHAAAGRDHDGAALAHSSLETAQAEIRVFRTLLQRKDLVWTNWISMS